MNIPSTVTGTPILLHLEIKNNVFRRFSTCGSVISTNSDSRLLNGLGDKFSEAYFASDYFWAYIDRIDTSRQAYWNRFMTQHGSGDLTGWDYPPYHLQLDIINNTFTQFNFLKDFVTDGDFTG